jgi:hypothetical protein
MERLNHQVHNTIGIFLNLYGIAKTRVGHTMHGLVTLAHLIRVKSQRHIERMSISENT